MNLPCPGTISNATYDKCIGNIKINDPKLLAMGLLLVFLIFMICMIFAGLKEDKQNKDAKGDKTE